MAGGGAAHPRGQRRARAGAERRRAWGMARWWRALPSAAGRYPWPTNVLLYGALFSAGDAMQQRLSGGRVDWRQTRCVATVAVTFHANFNYAWLRLLERTLPGRAPRALLAKVLCDQVVGAPVAVTAFYTGEMPGRGSGGAGAGVSRSWGNGGRGPEFRGGAGLEVEVQGHRSLGTRD